MQHCCACNGGSLTHLSMFCRQQGEVSSSDSQFCEFKIIPLFSFFIMESILAQLTRQETWEEFLSYRLLKGRFTWHEFDEADRFVEQKAYLHLAQKIAHGEGLGIPKKKIVNKMGTGKKRVVYSFAPDEMVMLKLIAFKLYAYDEHFSPNCYAFRRGIKASDAIFRIRRAIGDRRMWAYKLDIHDYFNSISIEILLPMLAEMMADDPLLYHFFEKMLTDNRVVSGGETILENHGVMAGIPTAPFLADVYLKEVDQFLDIVINDYEQFLNIINNLEKEKADLLGEIMSLKQELRNSKMNMEVAKESNDVPEVTNVDILRRLSQLEKMVYGAINKDN